MAENTVVKPLLLAVIAIFSLVYVFFYFNKKAYLKDNFQAAGSSAIADYNHVPRRTQIENTSENNTSETIVYPSRGEVQLTHIDTPYERTPINDIDDYEYNLVYANESNTAMSKTLRQKLMSQYPMHWTTYPPSSSQFQAGIQESFQNATQDVPDDAQPYQNISGSMMAPPDLAVMEKEERKILQTYRPHFPPKGATYDTRDANTLIKKIYDAKGLIANVKHKDGTNVYEIVGTRRKNEKVMYEDELAPTSKGAIKGIGEGTVNVPTAVNEMAGGGSGNRGAESNQGGSNPWQYTSWTPGLESTFSS